MILRHPTLVVLTPELVAVPLSDVVVLVTRRMGDGESDDSETVVGENLSEVELVNYPTLLPRRIRLGP